jgi:lysophospholipase L1-like esterase
MRAPLANALALGLGGLVALGLGEVGARVAAPPPMGPIWFAHDAELGAIPVPGERGERTFPGAYRYSFAHDAQGLRVVPAAAGVVTKQTVLVLGDSYTYGLGVDDDQTYCNLLQEALRPGPPARVVNAGNPAKGTDYALRFYLARQAALGPDVVLLAFFKNDFGDNARGTYFSLTPSGTLAPLAPKDARSARRRLVERFPGSRWLLENSQLVNLLRQTAVILTFEKDRPGPPTSAQRSPDGPRGFTWVDPLRQEETRRYLAALRDAVAEHGASLLVAYVPDARDCWLARERRPLSPDEAAFQEIARGLGLRFLSLTPALAASSEPIDRLYFDEGHWTPSAHAIAARTLAVVVRSLLVTAGPAPGGAGARQR